jgi:hypothetical protein
MAVFPPEKLAVCEILWKNIVELGRPQMTIWGVRIGCWIPKATNTHSEYVLLIAFPLQQWLHERSSVLRHLYIAILVCVCVCVCVYVCHSIYLSYLVEIIINYSTFFYCMAIKKLLPI